MIRLDSIGVYKKIAFAKLNYKHLTYMKAYVNIVQQKSEHILK